MCAWARTCVYKSGISDWLTVPVSHDREVSGGRYNIRVEWWLIQFTVTRAALGGGHCGFIVPVYHSVPGKKEQKAMDLLSDWPLQWGNRKHERPLMLSADHWRALEIGKSTKIRKWVRERQRESGWHFPWELLRRVQGYTVRRLLIVSETNENYLKELGFTKSFNRRSFNYWNTSIKALFVKVRKWLDFCWTVYQNLLWIWLVFWDAILKFLRVIRKSHLTIQSQRYIIIYDRLLILQKLFSIFFLPLFWYWKMQKY